MLRQAFAFATVSAVVAAAVALTATVARADFQQCIDRAAQQRQEDLANGVDQVTADAWYAGAIEICRQNYHR